MVPKYSLYGLLIFILFAFFVFNSCSDDNKLNSSGEKFNLNQFPLSVGSQWEYEVNDPRVACPACADTITVSIIDSTIQSSNLLKEIWHIQKNDTNQTWGQTVLQDSLKLVWDNFLTFKLKLPFEVGDIWNDNPNVSLYKDSTIVSGYGSVTVPAGTFDNAFILDGIKNSFESNSQFKMWVVPDVGIVRIDYSIEDPTLGIDVVSRWELISFSQSGMFNHFSAIEFPNSDGISWNYEYIYFNYNNGNLIDSSLDNIQVNLAESSTVAVWTYNFTDSTLIELVESSSDTVFVYSDYMMSQIKSKYIFPFSIDQNWTTGNRTTSISNIISFSLNSSLYFPTYLVVSEIDCGTNCTRREVEYLTPFVGLIYKTISEYDSDTQFANANLTSFEIWELSSYTIPFSTD